MVNFELNRDACEGKCLLLKFKFHLKSCNLIRIHAVISLSNPISDFQLLDDKMRGGKNTLATIHNTLTSWLWLLHWQAQSHFLNYLN